MAEDPAEIPEAVMTAIECFIRTGELWDGIPWMKRWQERVEE